jgi:hypothetical protein
MVLAHVARFMLRARGHRGEAIAMAEQFGALPRITSILKSIPFASTADGDFGGVLADARIASDAFIGTLSGQAIFATMVNDGALFRVPLNLRLGQIVAGSTGGIVDEGQIVPGSRLTLAAQTVPVIKGQSFIIVSNEVASAESAAATALINEELRKAVSAAVDAKFSAIAMAGASSSPSAGGIGEDLMDDVEALLAIVNAPGARLYWAMGSIVANRLAILDRRGEMTPSGGHFLGLPAIVSSTVEAGTLRLFDAQGFAGDLEGVIIETARQASIDLGEPPDSPVTAGTTLINLFQQNLSAIRATTYFGAVKLRTNAAAEITGIPNSPDSPA